MAGNRRLMHATETQLTNQDHKPGHHPRQDAGAIDIDEHPLRIRNNVIQAGAHQQDQNRQRHTDGRNAVARYLTDRRRQLTVLRQGVQHTSAAVHSAVAAGKRCRQHHEVDNSRRRGNTDFGKRQYERAAIGADLIPREDSDDNENRADVENQDPPQHFAHRAAQRHLRVFRFTCGNADELHPLIGRDHDTQRRQEALPAASKETTMFGEITKTDGVAAVAKAEENDAQPDDDHHDNGGHFYHGEPELDFTV
ncbi:Uncharacterised protein [Klebsiella pneumoniae]|nr:Uncharacterised protein [Klebsiella pneumoniae]